MTVYIWIHPVAWEWIRKWEGGHWSFVKVGCTDPAWNAGKKIFWVVPLHFFGSKSTISHFGERFHDVSTVWSVSCLLFFYSRCPHAQPFVKVGARAPLCRMELAPLDPSLITNYYACQYSFWTCVKTSTSVPKGFRLKQVMLLLVLTWF